MEAPQLVDILLEADSELEGEVDRYMATEPFDRGAADILRDARELYLRLQADGTLQTLRGEDSGRPGTLRYDDSAVAQAIIRRAIERRGARGTNKAYNRLKQLNYYNF